MAVFKLTWKDGSVSYKEGNTVSEAIGSDKVELLQEWWEVVLHLSPCEESLVMQYGLEESFTIPIKKLPERRRAADTSRMRAGGAENG